MNASLMQRKMKFLKNYREIKNNFFETVEYTFEEYNANYLKLCNKSTVGNEFHCDFENEKYLISVRIDIMSVDIYIWIYDRHIKKDRMFTLDNPSEKFQRIMGKRMTRATENLQERLLAHIENSLDNDELLNAEPAFEYYFNEGLEENVYIIFEYSFWISEYLKANKALI